MKINKPAGGDCFAGTQKQKVWTVLSGDSVRAKQHAGCDQCRLQSKVGAQDWQPIADIEAHIDELMAQLASEKVADAREVLEYLDKNKN